VRIALDLTGLPSIGGARSSALLWSERLAQSGDDHEFVIFASEQLTLFRDMGNVQLIARPLAGRGTVRAWAQWYIPRAITKLGIDVYHAMKNIGLLGLSCPTVITINDLTHVTLAHLDPLMDRIFWAKVQPRLLRQASSIIAISHATKDLLLRHYDLPEERVTVIYPPMDHLYRRTLTSQECQAVMQRHGLTSGYFLYVGSLGIHKNVSTILAAHKPIWERHGIPLVLVTGAEHTRSDNRLARELSASPRDRRTRHLGFVSGSDMPALYREATALVNPSLSEGFGLVTLEAMACGTPVIASDIPALREVVDGAGLFVNQPLLPSGFTDAMEQFLVDTPLRQTLSLHAAERAAYFSQMDTAGQTIAVYERVLGL